MDNLPTLDQLKTTFDFMSAATYDGVSGVVCIESGKEGPVVGITAGTHGNEPSGLAVFNYLLGSCNIEERLQCGALYLVLNNIEATKKFFASTNEQDQGEARYIEVNMNRLPPHVTSEKQDNRYEVKRARELMPIWERFSVGLDIHSTLVPMDPMIISRGRDFESIENLIRGFPISTLISNIDAVQIGIPAFALYGGQGHSSPVFAIEAGQHTAQEGFERACICAESLLKNLDMLQGQARVVSTELREYVVEDSIIFPSMDFDFVKEFKSYQKMKKGDVLAQDTSGAEITAPFDGHLLLPTSKRGDQKDISEEVSFLTRPVVHRDWS